MSDNEAVLTDTGAVLWFLFGLLLYVASLTPPMRFNGFGAALELGGIVIGVVAGAVIGWRGLRELVEMF